MPGDLPDVNVWLALSVPDHPHHIRAARYWNDESADEVAFCRVTSLALLRLLTNPAVMNGEPLSPAEAWIAYEQLRAMPEVTHIAEPSACESYLAAWSANGTISPRFWTDAYLAAVSQSANLRLVTFDNDFARFPDLDWLLLES